MSSLSTECSSNVSSGYVLGNFNAIGTAPVIGDGTICFFCRIIAFANTFGLLDWVNVYALYVDRGFSNALTLSTVIGGSTIQQNSTLIPVVNTWYFFAITVTNGTGTLYYKIVGEPTCTTFGVTVNNVGAAGAFAIGNNNNINGGNQARFAGFKWWSGRILTQSEVEAESRQISVVSPAGLYAYWSFDNPANVWSTKPEGGPLMLGTFSGNFTLESQKAGPPLPITIGVK